MLYIASTHYTSLSKCWAYRWECGKAGLHGGFGFRVVGSNPTIPTKVKKLLALPLWALVYRKEYTNLGHGAARRGRDFCKVFKSDRFESDTLHQMFSGII